MERLIEEISYKKCAIQREVVCDVSCDFTLPDYLGDIKRIIMTRESLSVGGAYLDAGQISGCGVVSYNVVYVDSEGKLSSAEFSRDYESSVRCEFDTLAHTYITSRIVNSTIRATTPRKLVAKSTVASNIHGFKEESIRIPEEFGSGKLEFKDDFTHVRSTSVTHLPEREYAERLALLEGGMADDLTVIARSASPEIKSVEMRDGVIFVKGEIKVECAVICAPLAPTIEKMTLEINEECPAGCKDPVSLFAIPNLSSLTVSVRPTEDGCELTCDLILDLTVLEDENIAVSMPTDAYSPGREVALEYNTVKLESVLMPISVSVRSEARKDRTELGLSEARDIIITDAVVRSDPARAEGDSIFLTGEIKYTGAATQVSEDGAVSYVSFKTSVPYEHIVNNTCQSIDTVTYDILTSVSGACCMIDKDEILLACNLCFEGVAVSDRTCRYISSVSMKEEKCEGASRRVVVYYPDKDESLYEVAKRFDTTSRAVANINSLGIDVVAAPSKSGGLSGVKRLIIY